jgi:aerobic carbon-monoxide dehydrogenase small subunit
MNKIKTVFRVNGQPVELMLEPRRLLVNVLREDLGLTGTHHACDTTNCGACTVLIDGKAVKSCTLLGVQANGKEILTIEGLPKQGDMHPLQRAFIDKQGLQCGFCTSGMIMSCYWMLSENKASSDEEIKRVLHGNICRCTGYNGIVEAVKQAKVALGASKR